MTTTHERLAQRALIVLPIALVSTYLAWAWGAGRTQLSDFGLVWAAAKCLVDGVNPYAVIGPTGAIQFPFLLNYPLTAAVAMLPFTVVSARLADALFIGLGAGLLGWALTRQRLANPQLCVFGSFAFLTVAMNVQWSLLITAAGLIPSLGFLLAAKPTIGLALLTAFPSRRAILSAAGFGLLTLVLYPWWPASWLAVLGTQAHIVAPVTLLSAGGPLVLLGLLKWRRPEARLLVALACVPHSPVLYETIALFLLVETWTEGGLLVLLTGIVWYLQGSYVWGTDFPAWMRAAAEWQVLCLYLPGLVMVLRRPNAWTAHDPMQTVVNALTSFVARRMLRPVIQEG